MKCEKCNNKMRLVSYDPDSDDFCIWVCDYCNHVSKTDIHVDGAIEAIINLKRIEDYYDK